jgi:hypothetical protein
MTQRLEPLYGEIANDDTLARSAWLPAGVYEGLVPAIAGVGPWTVSLGLGANGLSRWRAQGAAGSSGAKGNPFVREDGVVQVVIAAPSAQDRIDLVVGSWSWAAGPTDPVSGLPTGVQLPAQNAVYSVIQGTPGVTPVAPTPPDPDVNGRRPVILASVYVPHTGAAVISRWEPTDFRIDFMRATTTEVEVARGTYANLKARLDAIASIQQVQAMSFQANTPSTGGGSMSVVTFTTTKSFGPAITVRSTTTIGLTESGVYELTASYRLFVSTIGTAIGACKATLTYNGSTTITLDNIADTATDDQQQVLERTFYVDPTWTDPYITLYHDGNYAGSLSGSVKFLGLPVANGPLTILNADLTGANALIESATQTWPDSVLIPLIAQNGVGALTWTVVSGGTNLDGTTDPAATIVSGNQLQLAWTVDPSAPKTWTVKLQVTDSAGTPQTTNKTISIELDPYSAPALVITSGDKSFTAPSYPYNAGFTAAATGGVTPYTWAIVGGGTTLPGAAINATTGVVSSSVSGPGTWTLELQVTDSTSGTPLVTTKTINVVVATATGGGGGGIGGCAPAGTPFGALTGDIPIETVEIGTLVRAYDDQTFLPLTAMVEEVLVYQDRALMRITTDKGQVVVSRDHRAASPGAPIGPWMQNYPPVEAMQPGMPTKWETTPGVIEDAVVLEVEDLGITATVYHVRLDKGHLFIAGGLVSHNIKAKTP